MRWLFLDSSERGLLRLALMPEAGRLIQKTIRRPRVNVPVEVASFMDVGDTKDLTGICVVAGPGSFSAVRSGVLAANLLARFLHVPLAGVSVAEASDLSVLRGRLAMNDVPAVSYVAPVYDAEPNITC